MQALTKNGMDFLYDPAARVLHAVAIAPAPEEYRDFANFRAACQPDYKQCDAVFKLRNTTRFKTLQHYFRWCWQQPEAESLHAAWQLQH